ncbi:histone deacetylase HDT [Salix suchowensis]|nr:histone deacetylase HDT [Salix suchowensis]
MSSMEFWGVEVKAGEPLKVEPKDFCMIHLSQAALGESKKGRESVPLFVKVNEKKIVLGTLSPENIPQLSFDLVFETEFELSHNWKNGSVFFCGYQVIPDDDASEFSSDEEDFEFAKAAIAKDKAAKPEKTKATLVEPSKDDDEDDSDEDDESEEGMSLDEDLDDSDDESDSEDEETPKKAETSKKRANESATKTPVSSKKAKAATPQKSDVKKPGQVTPHPSKGKAAANGNSSKSPKSGGNFSCKSCEKSFGTDGALKSHSQAKHAAK